MDPNVPVSLQQHYVPAAGTIVGTVKQALRKVPVALTKTPELVCGMARRVGATGPLKTDLAIYRIKLKLRPELETVTLAGFFVHEEGIFHTYKTKGS